MWIRWHDVERCLEGVPESKLPGTDMGAHLDYLRSVYEHGIWLTNFAGRALCRLLPDLLLTPPQPLCRFPSGQTLECVGYFLQMARTQWPEEDGPEGAVQAVLHLADDRRMLITGDVIALSLLATQAKRGDGAWNPPEAFYLEEIGGAQAHARAVRWLAFDDDTERGDN